MAVDRSQQGRLECSQAPQARVVGDVRDGGWRRVAASLLTGWLVRVAEGGILKRILGLGAGGRPLARGEGARGLGRSGIVFAMPLGYREGLDVLRRDRPKRFRRGGGGERGRSRARKFVMTMVRRVCDKGEESEIPRSPGSQARKQRLRGEKKHTVKTMDGDRGGD